MSVFWELLKPVTPAPHSQAALKDSLAMADCCHTPTLCPHDAAAVGLCKGLPREAVESLFVELFKETLNIVLSAVV